MGTGTTRSSPELHACNSSARIIYARALTPGCANKQACFPTVKTIEQFDLAASSIPAPTWAYLTSLEWIRAKENLTLVGPAVISGS